MTSRKIAAALTILTLAVTMTMPIPEQASLPGTIAEQKESPVVARIGKVIDVIEAGNVTVEISGSPTLVQASFLFPAYSPLIGDLVYVTKQDSQWLVLGTMSGTINTLIPNSSFESGTVGSTPSGWTIVTPVTTAGTPTFVKELSTPIEGKHVGVVRNSSAGVAGTSVASIVSTLIPVTDINTRWGTGYFITFATPDVNASLEPQGGHIFVETFIQWFDAATTFLSEDSTNFLPIYGPVASPFYVRTWTTAAGDPYVMPPANATQARIRFNITFTMHINSASEIGIDVVYLRGVKPSV